MNPLIMPTMSLKQASDVYADMLRLITRFSSGPRDVK